MTLVEEPVLACQVQKSPLLLTLTHVRNKLATIYNNTKLTEAKVQRILATIVRWRIVQLWYNSLWWNCCDIVGSSRASIPRNNSVDNPQQLERLQVDSHPIWFGETKSMATTTSHQSNSMSGRELEWTIRQTTPLSRLNTTAENLTTIADKIPVLHITFQSFRKKISKGCTRAQWWQYFRNKRSWSGGRMCNKARR